MTPSSDTEDSGVAQDGAGKRVNNNYNNRSGGRGRGGNVGRGNENRASSGSKFEGSVPSLKKYIFALHGSSNMFMITQREISNYFMVALPKCTLMISRVLSMNCS